MEVCDTIYIEGIEPGKHNTVILQAQYEEHEDWFSAYGIIPLCSISRLLLDLLTSLTRNIFYFAFSSPFQLCNESLSLPSISTYLAIPHRNMACNRICVWAGVGESWLFRCFILLIPSSLTQNTDFPFSITELLGSTPQHGGGRDYYLPRSTRGSVRQPHSKY